MFFDGTKVRNLFELCKSFLKLFPSFSQLLKSNLRSRQSVETSTLVLGVSTGEMTGEMTGVIWER